jgi:ATP-dependent protease HslVU (ClpYQ) peptidase subunit
MRGVRAVTLCVGLEHDGETWIAGDSSCVLERKRIDVSAERKVWVANGWVLGFAGSWRAGCLVKRTLKPPTKLRDPDDYIHGDLIRACRAACHAEPDDELGALELLVGRGGKLWSVLPASGTALRSQHGYAAIGASGALEALAATATVTRPRARLLRVMHALLRHSTIVRAPVYVEHG